MIICNEDNTNQNNNRDNDIFIDSDTEIIFRIIHKILRLLYYTLYLKLYFHISPLQGNNSFLIVLFHNFLIEIFIITCSFKSLRSSR